MGISGLLKLLSPVTKRIHISEYANKRIAIDGYCWLHKAVYSCSQELCMNIPTTKFINYCVSLINMLRQYKIVPVIVFDGGPLPNKKVTEDDRRNKRDQMKAKAHAYLMEGNAFEANRCFQKAVDVTPTMAFLLIKVLRQMNIEYLVAPYEADAQLAYLAVTGQVDAVLTEDSDLVAYGTPNMLYKMDKEGYCDEIKTEDLATCRGKDYDLGDFNITMLRHMCILSGCDYLPSLANMGIKTSYKLLKKHRDIEKVFKVLRIEKGMTSEYMEQFHKADLTFRHQRVYDPCLKELVHFSPIDHERVASLPSIDFLGELIDNELAEKIAVGIVDPSTKETFDATTPTPNITFIPQPKKTVLNIYEKNKITNYFDKNSNVNNSTSNTKINNEVDDYEFDLESDEEDEDLKAVLQNTFVETTTTVKNTNKIVTSSYFSKISVEDSFEIEDYETNEEDEEQSTTLVTYQQTVQQPLVQTQSNNNNNNGKSFKKNSLVTDQRVSLSIFDQFMYKKKESSLLSSTDGNNNSNNNNNLNSSSENINNNNRINGIFNFEGTRRKTLLFSPNQNFQTNKRKDTFTFEQDQQQQQHSPSLKKVKCSVSPTSTSTPSSPTERQTDTQEDNSFVSFQHKKSNSLPSFNTDSIFDESSEDEEELKHSFSNSPKFVDESPPLSPSISPPPNISPTISPPVNFTPYRTYIPDNTNNKISSPPNPPSTSNISPSTSPLNSNIRSPEISQTSPPTSTTPAAIKIDSNQEVPIDTKKYGNTSDNIFSKYFTPTKTPISTSSSTLVKDSPFSLKSRLSQRFRESQTGK